MKLQGQKHYEYKGKKYEKFWIVIPSKLIEKLGWKKGDDLEALEKEGKITVKKKTDIIE